MRKIMDIKSTLYRCNMIFRPNPVGFFDQVTENRKCTGAAQANIGLPRISYLDLLPFCLWLCFYGSTTVKCKP